MKKRMKKMKEGCVESLAVFIHIKCERDVMGGSELCVYAGMLLLLNGVHGVCFLMYNVFT